MKSEYKRDIAKQYFRPLKSFHYNPSFHWATSNNKQTDLADELSKEYGIHEGNIFRLIIYTDIAWSFATESEIKMYYSDLSEIADFEKDPFTIDKIVFRGYVKDLGYTKSFEVTNPYLIDKLFYSMIDYFDFKKIIKAKGAKKKRTSEKIIKLIATELFNELTQVENVSEWRSYCIIGYIFSLYKIGLKNEEPILTKDEHSLLVKEKAKNTETYLQYLAGRIEGYIIK